MKTLAVLLVLLFSCSLAFADYATLAGVSWTPVTKTYSTNGTASGTIVWTPATGAKINLLGVFMSQSLGATPSTTIRLGTGILTGGTGTFVDVIPAVGIATGPIVIESSVPIWRGDANATLSITTSSSITPCVTLWGYETK